MPKSDQGIEVSLKRERYTVIPRTLIFITRNDRVLLLRGSAGKRIWANKYNGIGGHIERNEDIYSAARREVIEETGLEVEDLRLVGLINIDGDQPTGILLFVFAAESRSGEPVPSEEGTLEWIDRDQITQVDLVEDLPVILPRSINYPIDAPPFFAHYRYNEQDQLVIRFAGSSDFNEKTHAKPQSGKEMLINLCNFAAWREARVAPLKSEEPIYPMR